MPEATTLRWIVEPRETNFFADCPEARTMDASARRRRSGLVVDSVSAFLRKIRTG
jgi:hypothetical protein